MYRKLEFVRLSIEDSWKKSIAQNFPDAAGNIAIRFEDVYQLKAFPTPPMASTRPNVDRYDLLDKNFGL